MADSKASVLVVIVVIISCTLSAFLPDRDFDALRRETFAELRAVTDTGELLRGVDLKDVAENRGENR